jgi:hypothetical protein
MDDYRDKVMELVQDEGYDAESMLVACLRYMTMDDVKGMLELNDLL